MSSFGFRPNDGDRPRSSQPLNDTANPRDAWNNPIEQEPQRQQQQRPNPTGGNLESSLDDNAGVDEKTLDTIWDTIKAEKEEPQNNNQPQNQLQQQIDPKKQLDDYLASVGLEPIVLDDKDKEQIAAGDFSGVVNKMNDKVRQSHIKAMSGSKTMIDAAVKDAVTQAMAGANATYSGQMNLTALHTALPFTKDKVIGPVAQTVMQKFLDRKMSTEDAIEGVKRFFAHTTNKVNGENVNKNRNGNFGGSRPNPTDDAPEGGWLAIMRAK